MAAHPEKKPKRKKRKLLKLRLDEISPVDSPAQEPAVVAIMKRSGDNEDLAKRTALTSAADGHSHLIRMDIDGAELNSGETSWTDEHTHPWVRSPNGEIVIGRVDGHIHRVATISKTEPQTPEQEMTPEEIEKQKQEFEAMQKRAERAEKLSELNDAQREYHNGLAEDQADTFLSKSNEARQSEVDATVAKAEGDNPVIYTADNGDEFRKSDDSRMVKMAQERDVEKREVATYRAEADQARFEKQASEILSQTAGEDLVKVELLKAVAGIENENTRSAALEVLKAADSAFAKLGIPSGVSGEGTSGDPLDKLNEMAKSIQTRDGVSFAKAYDTASQTAEGIALVTENRETLRSSLGINR